jgi:hypothetical protein
VGATTGAWPHCPQPRPDARLRLVCLPSAQLVVPLTEAVPGQVRPPVLRRDHPTLRWLSINLDLLSNTATSVAPTSSYYWNTPRLKESSTRATWSI